MPYKSESVCREISESRIALSANRKPSTEHTLDGQFYWTHNDHLNSTRKLTNTSGAVVYRGEFDPYGKAVLETGSVSLNSHKFTGYERDWATGLDYANARMYTAQYGRFMQSDPVTQGCGNRNPDILAGARKRKPQSFNRYSYVYSDPINLIDPRGLDPYSGSNCFIEGGDMGDWSGGWAGGGPGFGGEGAWGASTGAGSCAFAGLALGESCEDCVKKEEQSCDNTAYWGITIGPAAVGMGIGAYIGSGVPVVGTALGAAAGAGAGFGLSAVAYGMLITCDLAVGAENRTEFKVCLISLAPVTGGLLVGAINAWADCRRSARSKCPGCR